MIDATVTNIQFVHALKLRIKSKQNDLLLCFITTIFGSLHYYYDYCLDDLFHSQNISNLSLALALFVCMQINTETS